MSFELLSIEKYPYKSWTDIYKEKEIDMDELYSDTGDWKKVFKKHKDLLEKPKKILNLVLDKGGHKLHSLPYPDLVFNSFKLTSFKNTKVVIIGQDPYFKRDIFKGKHVPQAMGLSFSVPVGVKVPSSLKNIYKNLMKYGHVTNIPKHGNLEKWASQGVLMLNSTLTVQEGYPNSHASKWKGFTDEIIKYISENKKGIVFLLWGRNAYDKKKLINGHSHIVASSHPSGLSFSKPMGKEPPFKDCDHFGLTNKYFKENGQNEIDWSI